MFDDDYLYSICWKHKDPANWIMQDLSAYEFQMMCEEHDKQLEEQDNVSRTA